jgi:hypothetical protein
LLGRAGDQLQIHLRAWQRDHRPGVSDDHGFEPVGDLRRSDSDDHGGFSAFKASDTLTVLTTQPTCTTAYTTTSNAGSLPAASCPGAVATNYSFTYVAGAVTVKPASLTITASNRTKNFGQTVTFVGTEFTSSGLLNSDKVTSVTLSSTGAAATATVTSPGPTYPIVPSAAMGTGLGNYTITYNTANFTITPASLTITASSGSMIYGGPVFPVTPSYNGFVNGDTPASLTTPPACSTVAAQGSVVGTYLSTCMGAAENNYIIGYMNGSVTIMQASTTTAVVSSSSNNTSTYMQLVTFTATVSDNTTGSTGMPTGTVTFYNNGVLIGPVTGTTLSPAACGTPPCPDQATLSTARTPASCSVRCVFCALGSSAISGNAAPQHRVVVCDRMGAHPELHSDAC